MRKLADLLAILAILSGLMAWLWGFDWRWAVTGLAAFVVLVIAGTKLEPSRGDTE